MRLCVLALPSVSSAPAGFVHRQAFPRVRLVGGVGTALERGVDWFRKAKGERNLQAGASAD